MGGELRQQNVNKAGKEVGRRWRRGSLKPLLLILTFQIDWFKLPVNQHLCGSRLLL